MIDDSREYDVLQNAFLNQVTEIVLALSRIVEAGGEELERFKQGEVKQDSKFVKAVSKLTMISLLETNRTQLEFAEKVKGLYEKGLYGVANEFITKMLVDVRDNVVGLKKELSKDND